MNWIYRGMNEMSKKIDIRLRAPEPEDLDVMLAVENDPDLWEHSCENTGPYTRFQMKQYIATNTNDIFTDRQLRFMITLADGTIVGMVDVFDYDVRNNRAEVGIVILSDFRGKGIGYSALCRLEEHCFKFLGINQLYSYVRCDNMNGRKLFRSCGFTETAVLRSWLRRGQAYYDVCLFQKISSGQNS